MALDPARRDGRILETVHAVGQAGETEPLPSGLDPVLEGALRHRGLGSLYSHQAEAFRAAKAGDPDSAGVVITTSTASGK